MLSYILVSMVLIAYLEVLGQWFLFKLKKNNYKLSFGFGFMLLVGYGYLTTAIPSTLMWSFNYLVVVYALFFIVSIVLIIKDIKKVNWHFSLVSWFIVAACCGVLVVYAYNTTFGNLNGFDSVYYFNLITSNICASKLNTTSPFAGYNWGNLEINYQYTFQSYYYFISVFIYFVRLILRKLTFDVYYVDLIFWIFQILYNCFLFSLIINGLDKISKNKKLLSLTVILIFTFFYGRYYYNNVFGFFGNTFRTCVFGYIILILFELFKDNSLSNKILLYVMCMAACGFSSSSIFTLVFLCFGLAFVLPNKDEHYFVDAAILLLLPLFNLYVILIKGIDFKKFIVVTVLCLLVAILNKPLTYLFKNKKFKIILLILSFLMMAFVSYRVTNNIFDFSAFFNNNSETADMYFNYFKPSGSHNKVCFIVLFDLLLVIYLIFNRNEYTKLAIVLIIVLYNPFCVSYLFSVNEVYHRGLDIFFNPLTFIIFLDFILNKINNKYFYYGGSVVLLGLFAFGGNYALPDYFHESFIPDNDYNGTYRMDNDEINVIREIDNDSKYRNILSAHICTPNLLTEANLGGFYTYTREYLTWYVHNAEYNVYCLFYPDRNNIPVYDYKNMNEYLWDSGIDYLVVDKTYEYYDEDEGIYDYLVRRVYECQIPFYENDRYAVFCFVKES